ncbi:hypothetical protein DdX_10229 [Ditylenchus destructor]|uniref:Uncharacterized protein n=1 Tax=Ditylenchus destructor TaxID=166010 RepID=A0AAD4R5R7_9BILA|nr:hypothetical protein DdX_10229 [Ditylenchus destructor]
MGKLHTSLLYLSSPESNITLSLIPAKLNVNFGIELWCGNVSIRTADIFVSTFSDHESPEEFINPFRKVNLEPSNLIFGSIRLGSSEKLFKLIEPGKYGNLLIELLLKVKECQ